LSETYIVSLDMIGKPFYTEVALFCQAMGQTGKEVDVYRESFSQIVASMADTNEQFMYNIMSLPAWATIVFTPASYTPVQEAAMARFREQIRVAAIQLAGVIATHSVIQKPDSGSVYLMVSVTTETLVFTIYTDAVYTETFSM
jgi:hypothetical protein